MTFLFILSTSIGSFLGSWYSINRAHKKAFKDMCIKSMQQRYLSHKE